MKATVAFLALAVGYALLYYMIVLFRQYNSTSPAQTKGIPLTVLLGIQQITATSPYATPPLRW